MMIFHFCRGGLHGPACRPGALAQGSYGEIELVVTNFFEGDRTNSRGVPQERFTPST